MQYLRQFGWVLCAAASMASPQQASASGTLLEIPEGPPCYKFAPQKVTISPPPHVYTFAGTCDLVHTRLALPIIVPFTAVGTFDPATGKTTEDINVPAPAINQPSRPYGHFLVSMRCAADPWRDQNVKCDQSCRFGQSTWKRLCAPPESSRGLCAVADCIDYRLHQLYSTSLYRIS